MLMVKEDKFELIGYEQYADQINEELLKNSSSFINNILYYNIIFYSNDKFYHINSEINLT